MKEFGKWVAFLLAMPLIVLILIWFFSRAIHDSILGQIIGKHIRRGRKSGHLIVTNKSGMIVGVYANAWQFYRGRNQIS